MVNVGGFFASLALTTDENSFKKGLGILNSFGNLGKGAAAGIVGLGTAFVALGASTANSMTKLDATAKQLGLNVMVLDNWQNAVRLAGGDSDSFTASLMSMNEAFRNLKIGEVKEDFIKATGMSGADFSKLQSMNTDQRIRAIWGALEKVQDPGKQQALIQKIFGQGGVDLFSRLQLQRTTLGNLYNQAAAMNPNTPDDYKTAVAGNQAQNSISVSFQNIVKKLGIEIEEALLPGLQGFSKWLVDNKKGFTEFAQAVGNVTTTLVGLINGIGGVIGNITGWFGEADKKQKYLEARKMTGPSMLNSQLSLLYGSGNENNYYKKFASGELTIDQINKIDSSLTRFNLFKGGQEQLAAMLPDSVIAAIAEKAAARAKGIYPGLRLTEGDQKMADLQSGVLRESLQKAELTLKIDGSKPLTKTQNDQIVEALSRAGVISVRQ